MDFDQLELAGTPPLAARCIDVGVDRLDQRGLAHAARAPEQRVVGRQTAREALGVLDQDVAHPVDALEQRHLDAIDPRHRASAAGHPGARQRHRRRRNPAVAAACGASRSSAAAMRWRCRRQCPRSCPAGLRPGGLGDGFRGALGHRVPFGCASSLSEPPADLQDRAIDCAGIRRQAIAPARTLQLIGRPL